MDIMPRRSQPQPRPAPRVPPPAAAAPPPPLDPLSLKLQKLRARQLGQPRPTRKFIPKIRRPVKHPKRELERQE